MARLNAEGVILSDGASVTSKLLPHIHNLSGSLILVPLLCRERTCNDIVVGQYDVLTLRIIRESSRRKRGAVSSVLPPTSLIYVRHSSFPK